MADVGWEGDIEDAENAVGEEQGAKHDPSPGGGTRGDHRVRALGGEDAGEDTGDEESLLGWADAAMMRLFGNQKAGNGNGQGDQQEGNARECQHSKQKGDQHDRRIRSNPLYSPITRRSLPSPSHRHHKQRAEEIESTIRPRPLYSPIAHRSLLSSEPPHTGNYRLKRSRQTLRNLSHETSPSIGFQPSQLSGTEKEEALHDGNYRRKRTRMGVNQEGTAATSAPSESFGTEAHNLGETGTGVQNRARRVNRPRKRWRPRAEW